MIKCEEIVIKHGYAWKCQNPAVISALEYKHDVEHYLCADCFDRLMSDLAYAFEQRHEIKEI